MLELELIDEVMTISDDEAMDIGRRLARDEGLLCGISSGAAVAAALRMGQRAMAGKRLVVMLASYGERYLSDIDVQCQLRSRRGGRSAGQL